MYNEFLPQSCRLSPFATENDCVDSAPSQTYSTLIEQLNSLQLAYLHLIEPRVHYNFDVETVDTQYQDLRALRNLFQGPVIAAGKLYVLCLLRSVTRPAWLCLSTPTIAPPFAVLQAAMTGQRQSML